MRLAKSVLVVGLLALLALLPPAAVADESTDVEADDYSDDDLYDVGPSVTVDHDGDDGDDGDDVGTLDTDTYLPTNATAAASASASSRSRWLRTLLKRTALFGGLAIGAALTVKVSDAVLGGFSYQGLIKLALFVGFVLRSLGLTPGGLGGLGPGGGGGGGPSLGLGGSESQQHFTFSLLKAELERDEAELRSECGRVRGVVARRRF